MLQRSLHTWSERAEPTCPRGLAGLHTHVLFSLAFLRPWRVGLCRQYMCVAQPSPEDSAVCARVATRAPLPAPSSTRPAKVSNKQLVTSPSERSLLHPPLTPPCGSAIPCALRGHTVPRRGRTPVFGFGRVECRDMRVGRSTKSKTCVHQRRTQTLEARLYTVRRRMGTCGPA